MADISKTDGPIVVTQVDDDFWHVDEAPEQARIVPELLGNESLVSAYFVIGGFVYEITGWNGRYFDAFRVAPPAVPLERPEPKAI